MTSYMPFLVPIGDLPDETILKISKALSISWGCDLIKISTNDSPNETISSLSLEDGLAVIEGDAAMTQSSSGGSWLEALASWKVPVVLIAVCNTSGEVPGIAASYVALCRELSVPLLGIVQLGEPWNIYERKLDGLPWCGFLPFDLLNDDYNPSSEHILEGLVKRLKLQFKYI